MQLLEQIPWSVSELTSGSLLFTYTLTNVAWAILKHFATGYLLYSVTERIRGHGLTVEKVIVALAGSVGPDLIDKPLTWVGVLEYGRSFSHSLFTTAAILAIVFTFARRVDNSTLGFAFAVGYLSHIFVDMFGEVFGGQPQLDTAFLFWPVVVKKPIGVASPMLPVARASIFGTIMLIAMVLWVLDGMIGISNAVRYARKRLRRW